MMEQYLGDFMNELKKNKFLIIIFIIIVGIVIYLLYFYKDEKEESYYRQHVNFSLKHYAENEYIPVNISYDQIARIYLQDYVHKLLYDRESAYYLINEEYRNAKFTSLDDFNEYVDEFMQGKKMQEMIVKKYSIMDKNSYKDYDVYDSADNLFIFRETGVMQYTVFFDRYTIKM